MLELKSKMVKLTNFKCKTANLPYMTRPGSVRFNTSLGQSSVNNHKMQGPLFSIKGIFHGDE